jgi:hypothetical protein
VTADGKPTVETYTTTIHQSQFQEPCPVCGVQINFERTEKSKDGKTLYVKVKKAEGEKHSVQSCIQTQQAKIMADAGYSEDAEICENCSHYINKYHCDSEYQYCGHPDFTFEKSAEMIEFQKEFERGEYSQDPKRGYGPFDVCKPYVDEAGRCDKYES